MLFTYPVAGAPDKVIALLVGMVLFVVNEANRVEKSSDYADGLYRRELSKQTHTCRLIPPRQVPCRFCALLPVWFLPPQRIVSSAALNVCARSPAASRVHANSISAVSSPQPKEDASSFPSVFSGFKI